MLILSRFVGKSIIINDNIKIQVLGISNDQVRLGILAPADIPVHREEIWNRILKEKEFKNE